MLNFYANVQLVGRNGSLALINSFLYRIAFQAITNTTYMDKVVVEQMETLAINVR